jgi:hypothetical protein
MSLDLLEAAALEFGDLLGQVAFLGGATIGVWITDPTARAPRVTYDVDVVAEVVTLGAYEAFQADLRKHGFRGTRRAVSSVGGAPVTASSLLM